MPNLDPADLPIRPYEPHDKQNNPGWPCTNGNCVHAEMRADGVYVTSTIDGNDGAVLFTHAEWNAFLDQVKAGHWDHTYNTALTAA